MSPPAIKGSLPDVIVYLHGFNSSPRSLKARCLSDYLNSHFPDIELVIPELPFSAGDAIEQISLLIKSYLPQKTVSVVGSSLGGYYGLHVAEKFQLKAALINPALRPYDLLSDYLGPNENLYTGEINILEAHHMDGLLALRLDKVSSPESIYVLTQTGDEVINYKEAVSMLPESPFWIQAGGNHDFVNFQRVIPAILSFFSSC